MKIFQLRKKISNFNQYYYDYHRLWGWLVVLVVGSRWPSHFHCCTYVRTTTGCPSTTLHEFDTSTSVGFPHSPWLYGRLLLGLVGYEIWAAFETRLIYWQTVFRVEWAACLSVPTPGKPAYPAYKSFFSLGRCYFFFCNTFILKIPTNTFKHIKNCTLAPAKIGWCLQYVDLKDLFFLGGGDLDSSVANPRSEQQNMPDL